MNNQSQNPKRENIPRNIWEVDDNYSYASELQAQQQALTSLKRLMAEQVENNRSLQRKNELLVRQVKKTEAAFELIKNDIAQMLEELQSQQERCEECERISLCRRRVLIVGGLSRMVHVYREIVERLEGQFDFHDGRCHNGNEYLRRQILQSDLVICPIDINSHAACLEVKRVCKRTRKEFLMLRKSSVSSVYSALITAANDSDQTPCS